ncbi:acyltransferase family protein [Flavobacterium sp. RHBU_24]|uniref:acyltransferase family protein n=1 Tax=Flavobacterium sp. RHBU_24 TaxID=3391185 RepID=UPI003985218E
MAQQIQQHLRIEWIDALKGIGILSVVVGHIYSGNLKLFIFLFHMPLFFFIGGFLFKPVLSFKDFFSKKTIHLLVPYFAFLVCILTPQEIMLLLDGKETILKWIIRFVCGGVLLFEWTGVFWFTTCFFLTQQVYNYIIVKFSYRIVWSIVAFFLMLAYANYLFFKKMYFPWAVNVVFYALPIMHLGWLYKKNSINQLYLLAFSLVSIVLLLLFWQPSVSLDMKSNSYGIPGLSFILGLSIIVVLIKLAQLLEHISFIKNILSYIGKASMVIMFMHQVIQYNVRDYVTNNAFIRIIVSLIFSIALYAIFEKFTFTRALFLGSQNDFKKVFQKK